MSRFRARPRSPGRQQKSTGRSRPEPGVPGSPTAPACPGGTATANPLGFCENQETGPTQLAAVSPAREALGEEHPSLQAPRPQGRLWLLPEATVAVSSHHTCWGDGVTSITCRGKEQLGQQHSQPCHKEEETEWGSEVSFLLPTPL